MENLDFFGIIERFRMLVFAAELAPVGDLLQKLEPVGLLPLREKYVEDIVFCRLIFRPRNNSFTVLRYLSDSAQYNRKLQAAFSIVKKLQTLLMAKGNFVIRNNFSE